jgi:hypothetical protein
MKNLINALERFARSSFKSTDTKKFYFKFYSIFFYFNHRLTYNIYNFYYLIIYQKYIIDLAILLIIIALEKI